MRGTMVFLLTVLVAAGLFAGGRTEAGQPSAGATGYDPDRMYTFVRAGNHPYPPEPDGKLLEYWRQEMNVDLQIRYLESQTAREQLNLLIASGEIPDVLPIAFTEIQTFIDQGVVGGWEESFLREHAPNLARSIDEWLGDQGWALSKIDGLMYTIPAYSYNARYAKPVVVRTDWLENVGIHKMPETLEEAEAMLYAFTRNDPDGNGVNDTYGLSREGLTAIYGAFGFQLEDQWLPRDGKLMYGAVFPEAKDALRLLAKWYADGVLDPEYITGENTGGYWALSHSFGNGRIGLTSAAAWYHWQPAGWPNLAIGANTDLFYSVNPDGEFGFAAPFIGPNGDRGTSGWFAVQLHGAFSADLVQDKERFAKLLSFIDYFCETPENMLTGMKGFQGVDWSLDADGNVVMNPDSPMVEAEERYRQGGETVSISYFDPGFIMETEYRSRFAWGEEAFGDKNYPMRTALPVPLPSAHMYQVEGQQLLAEGYHEIISGQKPIDYFDQLVERWYAIGGEQLTREANEWYADYLENL